MAPTRVTPSADLPRSIVRLIGREAEASIAVINLALSQLIVGPAMTPTELEEWQDRTVAAAARPLVLAWNSLEPGDLHLAGAHAIVAVLREALRGAAAGVAVLKQHQAASGDAPSSPDSGSSASLSRGPDAP